MTGEALLDASPFERGPASDQERPGAGHCEVVAVLHGLGESERRMIVFRHGDGERVDLYRCPPGCREHAGCMVKPRVTSTTIGDRRVWQVECSCLRYKGGIVGRFLSWDAAMDAAVVHVRWFHHLRSKIMAALTGAPMAWSNREAARGGRETSK